MERSGWVPYQAYDHTVAPENPRRMNRALLSLWAVLMVVFVASFAALL